MPYELQTFAHRFIFQRTQHLLYSIKFIRLDVFDGPIWRKHAFKIFNRLRFKLSRLNASHGLFRDLRAGPAANYGWCRPANDKFLWLPMLMPRRYFRHIQAVMQRTPKVIRDRVRKFQPEHTNNTESNSKCVKLGLVHTGAP